MAAQQSQSARDSELFASNPDVYYANLRAEALRKAEAEEAQSGASRRRRTRALIRKFQTKTS